MATVFRSSTVSGAPTSVEMLVGGRCPVAMQCWLPPCVLLLLRPAGCLCEGVRLVPRRGPAVVALRRLRELGRRGGVGAACVF